MEEKVKEKYMEFQMLQQQAEQINKYLEEVTEKIAELAGTKQALDEIAQVKEGTDAFVPLSQGIFVKAKIAQSDKMLVAVGGEVAAEKSVDQVKEIIDKQVAEAEQAHIHLQQNLAKLHQRIPELMMELKTIQDVQKSA